MSEIILTTESELQNIVSRAIREALSTTTSQTQIITDEGNIKGIAGLSKFLGVCHSRAQAIKNSGILPYFQTGRTIIFDPSKVREAMEAHGKRDRRSR